MQPPSSWLELKKPSNVFKELETSPVAKDTVLILPISTYRMNKHFISIPPKTTFVDIKLEIYIFHNNTDTVKFNTIYKQIYIFDQKRSEAQFWGCFVNGFLIINKYSNFCWILFDFWLVNPTYFQFKSHPNPFWLWIHHIIIGF